MGEDFEIESRALDRRRALAQSLLQSTQNIPQGRMAGRIYVPASPVEHLANVVRQFGARKDLEGIDSEERALGQRRREQTVADIASFQEAMNGKPAQNIPHSVANDDEGNAMPAAVSAAVAPDRSKALAIALRNQSLAPVGMKMIERDMDDERRRRMLASILHPQGQSGNAGPVTGAPSAAGSVAPGVGPLGSAGGAAPGAGGSLDGIPPQALALIMSGDASLAKLGETMLDRNKPIPLREGDLVVPDGRGGFRSAYSQPKLDAGMRPVRGPGGEVVGAEAIPGYAEGVGAITGAKEGAKAGFEMVTVETPDGPRMMTKQQAAQLSGGATAAPRMQPGSQPPARTAPAERTPVQQPRPGGVDADRAAIYRQEMQQAQQRLAAARNPEEQERARQDVAGLTREMQRIGIPLMDDTSKKFGERVATKSAEELMEGREKARNAINELASVREARKAVASGVYQGSGANAKLAVAKFINANIPGIQVDPEKAGNTDYLKSVVGQGLLAQAKTLGANPSNADAKRIEEIVGGIDKDPLAMQKILDFREEMAIRAVEGYNRTVDDAESRGLRSPYDLRVKQQGKGGATRAAAAVPSDIEAILKKHGGN